MYIEKKIGAMGALSAALKAPFPRSTRHKYVQNSEGTELHYLLIDMYTLFGLWILILVSGDLFQFINQLMNLRPISIHFK